MTKTELKNELLAKNADLSIDDWNTKCKYRGVHIKKDYQLDGLEDSLPEKIDRTQVQLEETQIRPLLTAEQKLWYEQKIQEIKTTLAEKRALRKTATKTEKEKLIEEQDKLLWQKDELFEEYDREDRVNYFKDKVDSLEDKFIATVKEKEIREKDLFSRSPIGTTYYIDYVNGLDSNDGLSTSTAWKTLPQYTSVTTRTPGDTVKVRANQTHTYNAADISFTDDGNVDNLITIKGCSIADDPWGDASDVKPIISFGDAAYNMVLITDYFWNFEKLELIESDDSNGVMYISSSLKTYFTDCVIRDNDPSGIGIKTYRNLIDIDGCEFYNNLTKSLVLAASIVNIKNSTLNGGAVTTDYGIYLSESLVYIENSSLGATTTHDIADTHIDYTSSTIYTRNCNLASGTEFKITNNSKGAYSEDHDQVKGDQKRVAYNGVVTRDTGTVRSGGATSSAKLEPNSYTGLYFPLTIADDFAGDFKLWTPASQKTITIYLQTFGYSTLPTASELYIEASYLDESSGGRRATIASTQTVSANASWTGFSVTLTPSQEGWVYVTLNLKKYEASSGIFVDIKPVVS